MDNSNNQECFISTFSRLRESSKDAVVSAEFSDAYTMYMHVNRPVQDRFVSVLEKAAESEKAALILLCGSVGDGKSHMLSYCRENYPEMMAKFYIHNDSTASLYIDKPASYTLMRLMEDFTDENIRTSKQKVILAINLGTLNNFLEADREGKFSRLKEYVEQAGILNEEVGGYQGNEYFYSVNFADYHLYELTSEGPRSEYISGLLNKITQKKPENFFYQAYCGCCKNCSSYSDCPIRINYDLLSDDRIQRGIVDALLECIVKNKLLVSTRSLLNFIYEIVVDERFFARGSLEPRKLPLKMTSLQYSHSLLPNLMFERKDSSEILNAMKSIDPLGIRNEKIDNFFVYYENTDDIIHIFRKDLPFYAECIERIRDVNFSTTSAHLLKDQLLHLFVRLCCLSGSRKDLLENNTDYTEYMEALYCWNTGNAKGLKNIYSMAGNAALMWNGRADKNEMQLPVGNKKSICHLLQRIEIKPVTDNLPHHGPGTLYSFRDELRLKYQVRNQQLTGELDVDFALYTLLKRILNGYVPSVNDKRMNVKCTEFVKKIARGGSRMEEVIVRDFSHRENKEYKLQYDEDFECYSFEEL